MNIDIGEEVRQIPDCPDSYIRCTKNAAIKAAFLAFRLLLRLRSHHRFHQILFSLCFLRPYLLRGKSYPA